VSPDNFFAKAVPSQVSKSRVEVGDLSDCNESVSAFEPTDEELEVSDVTMDNFDISWDAEKGGYTATIAKKKTRKSQKDDDFSDLDDFIVKDGEEDDSAAYKPRKSKGQQRKPLAAQKKKNNRVIISEDEESPKGKRKQDYDSVYELSEESDDERLHVDQKKLKQPETGPSTSNVSAGKKVDIMNKPTMISEFLPSTKMKHMMKYLQDLAESNPDDKVSSYINGQTPADVFDRLWSCRNGRLHYSSARIILMKTISAMFASKDL
jgi:hypothetical protein